MAKEISSNQRERIIRRAIDMMERAADVLNPLYDDPRVKAVICELEGSNRGWYQMSDDEVPTVADQLVDLLTELKQPGPLPAAASLTT